MIRGTEQAFKFRIPCSYDDLSWVTAHFWQPNNNGTGLRPLPIIKTTESFYPSGENTIVVQLSAEETARFSEYRKAFMQMRAEHDGVLFGCKKRELTVYPMKDGITDDYDGYIILDGGFVNVGIDDPAIYDGDFVGGKTDDE